MAMKRKGQVTVFALFCFGHFWKDAGTSAGRSSSTLPAKKRPATARAFSSPATAVAPECAGMFSKVEGSWRLAPAVKPEGTSGREGRYVFDPKTFKVHDTDGEPIAKIVFTPIAGTAARLPKINDAYAEVSTAVKVVSGEVMKAIQDPANAEAYFVLPSQLNGAEYPDYNHAVHKVSDYHWDNTAGPRGQLSVHPAVAQFLLNNAARDGNEAGIDQTRDLLAALRVESEKVKNKKIESLATCLAGFELQNGYLAISDPPSAEDGAASPKLQKDVIDIFARHLGNLKTLAAKSVSSTGLRPDLRGWAAQPGHKVTLIYASAVPVDTYNNPTYGDPDTLAFQRSIASLLLRGAYFGALRLALEDAQATKASSSEAVPLRKKVFLMPLGGGVFNNAREDIARSVIEAVRMASSLCKAKGPKLHELLDIRMLTWEGKPSEATSFAKLLEAACAA